MQPLWEAKFGYYGLDDGSNHSTLHKQARYAYYKKRRMVYCGTGIHWMVQIDCWIRTIVSYYWIHLCRLYWNLFILQSGKLGLGRSEEFVDQLKFESFQSVWSEVPFKLWAQPSGPRLKSDMTVIDPHQSWLNQCDSFMPLLLRRTCWMPVGKTGSPHLRGCCCRVVCRYLLFVHATSSEKCQRFGRQSCCYLKTDC